VEQREEVRQHIETLSHLGYVSNTTIEMRALTSEDVGRDF
jgi:hypothetical protein